MYFLVLSPVQSSLRGVSVVLLTRTYVRVLAHVAARGIRVSVSSSRRCCGVTLRCLLRSSSQHTCVVLVTRFQTLPKFSAQTRDQPRVKPALRYAYVVVTVV